LVASSSKWGIGDGLLPGGIVELQKSKVAGIGFAADEVAMPNRWRQYSDLWPVGKTVYGEVTGSFTGGSATT
jgi:hypothetical protein